MMMTIVRYVTNVDLWQGELPLIPKGHQININGKSFRAMDSAVVIEGDTTPTQLILVGAARGQ